MFLGVLIPTATVVFITYYIVSGVQHNRDAHFAIPIALAGLPSAATSDTVKLRE